MFKLTQISETLLTLWQTLELKDAINTIITFNNFNNKSWDALAVNTIVDYNFLYGGANILSLYIYDNEGNKIDNITTWGLIQFTKFYKLNQITKLEIFNYLYGVLSSPNYKNNYEQNLRREFPRIPFYKNFYKWSNWGKRLMDLHINYETIEPFKLKQITNDNKEQPKAKLKANRETGIIVLDENTTLTGVPPEAWNYKLGNRSALEWVLDQYKESKPKDPTIAEKFNTYKFADYKEQVIDLLKRVCTVSVETMKIIEEMKKENE